jgi:hypothetical protein
MSVLFILAIIAGVFAVGSLIAAACYENGGLAGAGLALAFLGVVLWGVGATMDQDRFNEETVRICDSKGGTVSKDNHCFVDGTPVQFSPGVWQRNA